jgi:hypothetical protein
MKYIVMTKEECATALVPSGEKGYFFLQSITFYYILSDTNAARILFSIKQFMQPNLHKT